ncbi:disco-interacting protein 2 homolog B-A-like [Gryllus bimaculatus]|nr:disco-interacting protein 2 homolog B-A-like [Gryllus bimaculatus]
MADFNIDISTLPEDVRDKLAELDLELSEEHLSRSVDLPGKAASASRLVRGGQRFSQRRESRMRDPPPFSLCEGQSAGASRVRLRGRWLRWPAPTHCPPVTHLPRGSTRRPGPARPAPPRPAAPLGFPRLLLSSPLPCSPPPPGAPAFARGEGLAGM